MATGDHGEYRPDDPDEFPEEELAPDEAPTPSWYPLLGIALALIALFVWLLTRPAGKTAEELAEDAATGPETAESADQNR